MLDQYLECPFTVSERLALPQLPQLGGQRSGVPREADEIEQFLSEWQLAWDSYDTQHNV